MHRPTSDASDIESLLRTEQFSRVIEACDRLLSRHRNSLVAWMGRARANLALGQWCDADGDSKAAERLAPDDASVLLVRATVHHRLGRMDEAVELLERLLSRSPANQVDVAVTLAETLHRVGRGEALASLLARPGPWNDDPRLKLHRSRQVARTDPDTGLAELQAMARSSVSIATRRAHGFEAVALLDRMGRHREAWAFAAEMHATTTQPFDVGSITGDVREQAAALASGRPWFRPKGPPVQGVAMVVALPRSGTTLLEQMLDAHPSIAGIGEYEGVKRLGDGVVSSGLWPLGMERLSVEAVTALRRRYLDGAAAHRRTGASWTLDKTLHAWRWLPAIAAVLPGTVCFHMVRDPRDVAVSLFLSNFHRRYNGWTADLGSIRRVIEAERSILPEALGTLGLPHECLVYEDLVADPQGHATRCLDRLGLPMTDAVLRPEANRRSVLTLSHEQVRNPINAGSIGRWRNYAWAFDGAWDALAQAHDARRRARSAG